MASAKHSEKYNDIWKALKHINPTPWHITVYSSKSHWGVIIPELNDSFPTYEDAEKTAELIEKERPNYKIEIYYEY